MTSSTASSGCDPEIEALQALARGDLRQALSILMQAYGRALYRYCYNVLRCRMLADDVHQTVFVQTYRDLPSFRGSSLRSWLYAIAHHRCLDALKGREVHERHFSLQEVTPDEPDPSPSSEERLVQKALAAALDECLCKLDPHKRIAVLLRHQEGFTYEEMGRICREDPATLRQRVTRALPSLRRCLEEKGFNRER